MEENLTKRFYVKVWAGLRKPSKGQESTWDQPEWDVIATPNRSEGSRNWNPRICGREKGVPQELGSLAEESHQARPLQTQRGS